MRIRDNKGSITVFVLVGLLFMTGFLIISFGSNINKSKSAKEQLDIISSTYSHGDGDANAYERAYTDIRRRNAQILTESSEDSSTLELTKTFTDKLSNYRIYGNSVQNGTPSPDNPVEIQSVGDKSKNLINYKELFEGESITISGITYNKTVEGIVVNGTSTGWASTGLKIDLKPVLEVGKTYVISGGKENVGVIFYSITSGTANYSASKTITGEEEKISVYLQVNPEKTVNNVLVMPQLEEGITATDYEPYGYKIPVKVRGKNLFNKEMVTLGKNLNADTGALYNSSTRSVSDFIEVKANTTYSLNLGEGYQCIIDQASTPYATIYNTDKSFYNVITKDTIFSTGYTFTSPIDGYVRVNMYKGMEGYVQLEEGSIATDYEPYVEPQIVNIYLDEPLRRIGNYEDYIDFTTGKIVRKICSVLYDGSDDEPWATWGVNYRKEGITGFYAYYGTSKLPDGSKETMEVYCNIAPYKSVWGGSEFGCANNTGSSGYAMLALYNTDLTDVSTSENAVSSLRTLLSTVGVEYHYVLKEPDDSETIELPELSTFEDYTRIEVLTEIAPSKIEATYYGYTME